MKISRLLFILAVAVLYACNTGSNKTKSEVKNMDTETLKGTYGFDKQFLSEKLNIVELKEGNARVLIAPEYQGRVMTSSAKANEGFSYGWINHELIESGELQEHINAFGGEERFWIGPEGGQFSIYFKPGVAFDFENWFVPKEIDTEEFELVTGSATNAEFKKDMKLLNFSGTELSLSVNRDISILGSGDIASLLEIDTDKVEEVAYETKNTITNTGDLPWTKESGMLSVWLLGMMNPSDGVTVVIPVKEGAEEDLGTAVNDDYFGKISSNRLKVVDNTVYFKADGKSRGKIGISPKRALPLLGSWDAINKALTVVEVVLPEKESKYVNSTWEMQDNPFSGDAINSYNDGPLEDGSQMGPFYEIESSSPALALKAGEAYTHIQRTYHFEGNTEELNKIALKLFGVTIEEIEKQF